MNFSIGSSKVNNYLFSEDDEVKNNNEIIQNVISINQLNLLH